MFEKIDYIYMVYTEKSFSKAAKKLFISQPSLSAAVKKVETELGVEIFNRTNTSVQLTTFGKHYIDAIEKIFEMEDNLKDLANDFNHSNAGSIVVGSNSLYVSYVLPAYVFKFMQQFPNINLTVFESNTQTLENKLIENELDIILDNRELNGELFEKCYFGTEFLLVAVPKEFSCNRKLKEYQLVYNDIKNDIHIGANFVPFEEFRETPFIIMTKGNDTRNRTDAIFNYYDVMPKVVMELNQLSTVFAFSSTGSAACIISDTLIKKIPSKADNMYFYALPATLARRDVFWRYKKKKNQSKAISSFINAFIKNEI
ncbi:MAG: LysR family transcriptional regulator [Oscillospiraceae bacterium]|nr:LysR family transcriptional regulator [Oscillospiraceae bacterium]